jgi:transcriptional regulator with XRE-family HTH domain
MKERSDDRQHIASVLRALRAEAGLSTTELAERLGWSQSKVSRTELGRTLAKPDEVDAWTRTTKADRVVRDEVLEIARRATAEFTEWRRELAPGRRRVQEEIRRMESAASVTRVFSMQVVPGLAQTWAYAEVMFRLGREGAPADEPLDQVVRARLARQSVLRDKTKTFYLVMSEMALRRRLIPPAEMREQVERLIELSQRRNIMVGVIPFDANEHVQQYHAFGVLGDPDIDDESIVRVETVTRAIRIRAQEEVAQYIAYFEALRTEALEGDELREFLREVVAGLE